MTALPASPAASARVRGQSGNADQRGHSLIEKIAEKNLGDRHPRSGVSHLRESYQWRTVSHKTGFVSNPATGETGSG